MTARRPRSPTPPPPRAAVAVGRARIGRGLFAACGFAPGAPILWLRGRVVPWQLLWRRGESFLANCIRFGDATYLDPGRSPGRYLNHACEPNTAIARRGRRLLLWAVRAIRRGDELTFDYSTTIGDDDIWRLRCRCGARRCRRWIARLSSLPPARLARYRRRGMIPAPVLRTLGQVVD